MGRYFGTDGFRGVANEELTAEKAFVIGRYLGWKLQREGKSISPRVVIGKDTRRSGYMLESALVAGLVSSGADAYLLHVTTTPSVAYVIRLEGFDCGIMISASHNPFYDNGIKLFNARGEKMEGAFLLELEEYIDSMGEGIPRAKEGRIGRSVDYVAGRNRYVGYLISLGMYSFKGWKVGLDCANGSAWHIAKSVFDALGASTYLLSASPNGENINADCGSTHVELLQRFVIEKGLDVGFAFDGDADRCLCVDEKGDLVDGDKMLYVCGKYMKERGELIKNTLVATVMSNYGLEKALAREGIICKRTGVGDRQVYDYMSKMGYSLGGEQSGHVIFSKYACTGDGVLTALKMMEIMLKKKSRLSALTADMVPSPQILKNVAVRDKERIVRSERLRKEMACIEAELGEGGRVLIRASGTEPVFRILVESEEVSLCEKYALALQKIVKELDEE